MVEIDPKLEEGRRMKFISDLFCRDAFAEIKSKRGKHCHFTAHEHLRYKIGTRNPNHPSLPCLLIIE